MKPWRCGAFFFFLAVIAFGPEGRAQDHTPHPFFLEDSSSCAAEFRQYTQGDFQNALANLQAMQSPAGPAPSPWWSPKDKRNPATVLALGDNRVSPLETTAAQIQEILPFLYPDDDLNAEMNEAEAALRAEQEAQEAFGPLAHDIPIDELLILQDRSFEELLDSQDIPQEKRRQLRLLRRTLPYRKQFEQALDQAFQDLPILTRDHSISAEQSAVFFGLALKKLYDDLGALAKKSDLALKKGLGSKSLKKIARQSDASPDEVAWRYPDLKRLMERDHAVLLRGLVLEWNINPRFERLQASRSRQEQISELLERMIPAATIADYLSRYSLNFFEMRAIKNYIDQRRWSHDLLAQHHFPDFYRKRKLSNSQEQALGDWKYNAQFALTDYPQYVYTVQTFLAWIELQQAITNKPRWMELVNAHMIHLFLSPKKTEFKLRFLFYRASYRNNPSSGGLLKNVQTPRDVLEFKTAQEIIRIGWNSPSLRKAMQLLDLLIRPPMLDGIESFPLKNPTASYQEAVWSWIKSDAVSADEKAEYLIGNYEQLRDFFGLPDESKKVWEVGISYIAVIPPFQVAKVITAIQRSSHPLAHELILYIRIQMALNKMIESANGAKQEALKQLANLVLIDVPYLKIEKLHELEHLLNEWGTDSDPGSYTWIQKGKKVLVFKSLKSEIAGIHRYRVWRATPVSPLSVCEVETQIAPEGIDGSLNSTHFNTSMPGRLVGDATASVESSEVWLEGP